METACQHGNGLRSVLEMRRAFRLMFIVKALHEKCQKVSVRNVKLHVHQNLSFKGPNDDRNTTAKCLRSFWSAHNVLDPNGTSEDMAGKRG